MQKLEERNTYTPADIPHVRSNCDLSLNSSEGRNSVLGKMPDLKTSSNQLRCGSNWFREVPEQDLWVSVIKTFLSIYKRIRSTYR